MRETGSVLATVAATAAAPEARLEIVGERRRAYSAEFRAAMVAQSRAPGMRVRELARHHGVCASLIYRWRREHPQEATGVVPRLLPVQIGTSEPPCPAPPPASAEPHAAGRIEIELEGGVRVRVDAEVSLAALHRVISALRG